MLQAWNFHPPISKLVNQFDIKYDTSYWGNSSNVHASFPTFSWPVLSKLAREGVVWCWRAYGS